MTTSPENQIIELFRNSTSAYESKDWALSEKINRRLLTLIGNRTQFKSDFLVTVARRYLASIVCSEQFINMKNLEARKSFEINIKDFREFITKNENLATSLNTIEQEISELQLYFAKPRSDTLNKAARVLRRIGRPDLAVELCTYQLQKTRLNYYSLISRSWALCDLNRIKEAISDAELARTYDSTSQNYSLVALSRAYRFRFAQDGLSKDFEDSIEFARKALKAKRNYAAAEAFICIARKMDSYEEEIQQLTKEFPHLTKYVDKIAVESAIEIVEGLSNLKVPLITEFDDIEEFSNEDLEEDDFEEESYEEYYADYFPEHAESLANPQMPHLEP